MMLANFNKLANKIIAEASASEWSVDQVNSSKYEFKTDENGNSVCVFQITRNSDIFTVTAVITDNEIKFLVAGEDGTINELSQKKFAVEYWKDYEDFQRALKKKNETVDDGASGDEPLDVEIPKIDTFKEVLDGQDDDKVEKTYSIKGHNFVLRKLKDPLTPDYCEILFDTVDKESKEPLYNKALAICKTGKNVVLKILQFNEKGERVNIIMMSDLEKLEPEIKMCLDKAMVKFSRYLADMEL